MILRELEEQRVNVLKYNCVFTCLSSSDANKNKETFEARNHEKNRRYCFNKWNIPTFSNGTSMIIQTSHVMSSYERKPRRELNTYKLI